MIETDTAERSFSMKNSIKKILAATLAAAMVFTVAPATAFAAGSKTSGTTVPTTTNKTVDVDSKTVDSVKVDTSKAGATIKNIDVAKNAKTVNVPSKVTVDGVSVKVTKLGSGALNGISAKVVLPTSITKLGNAFKGSKVTNVTIKTTKKLSVASNAFNGYKGKKLTITLKSGKNYKANVAALRKAAKKAGIKLTIKKSK